MSNQVLKITQKIQTPQGYGFACGNDFQNPLMLAPLGVFGMKGLLTREPKKDVSTLESGTTLRGNPKRLARSLVPNAQNTSLDGSELNIFDHGFFDTLIKTIPMRNDSLMDVILGSLPQGGIRGPSKSNRCMGPRPGVKSYIIRLYWAEDDTLREKRFSSGWSGRVTKKVSLAIPVGPRGLMFRLKMMTRINLFQGVNGHVERRRRVDVMSPHEANIHGSAQCIAMELWLDEPESSLFHFRVPGVLHLGHGGGKVLGIRLIPLAKGSGGQQGKEDKRVLEIYLDHPGESRGPREQVTIKVLPALALLDPGFHRGGLEGYKNGL